MGVRARALADNSSPRVGGARDVNNLSHAGRVQFNALGDAMRGYRNLFMCTRREGTIAGALGHSLLELILLRCGERRECDARILLQCGDVQQPKILLDLGCARRDRVAIHALGCGCAAAQRDARGRGVCLLLTSR